MRTTTWITALAMVVASADVAVHTTLADRDVAVVGTTIHLRWAHVLLPDSGHLVPRDEPQAIVDAVKRVLEWK